MEGIKRMTGHQPRSVKFQIARELTADGGLLWPPWPGDAFRRLSKAVLA